MLNYENLIGRFEKVHRNGDLYKDNDLEKKLIYNLSFRKNLIILKLC